MTKLINHINKYQKHGNDDVKQELELQKTMRKENAGQAK